MSTDTPDTTDRVIVLVRYTKTGGDRSMSENTLGVIPREAGETDTAYRNRAREHADALIALAREVGLGGSYSVRWVEVVEPLSADARAALERHRAASAR